jgi:hypothetical protein
MYDKAPLLLLPGFRRIGVLYCTFSQYLSEHPSKVSCKYPAAIDYKQSDLQE